MYLPHHPRFLHPIHFFGLFLLNEEYRSRMNSGPV